MNTRPDSSSQSSGKGTRHFVAFLLLVAFWAGLIVGVPMGAWMNRSAWMRSSNPAIPNDPESSAGSPVEAIPNAITIIEQTSGEAPYPSPTGSLEADILRGLEERLPEPVLPEIEIPKVPSGQSHYQ